MLLFCEDSMKRVQANQERRSSRFEHVERKAILLEFCQKFSVVYRMLLAEQCTMHCLDRRLVSAIIAPVAYVFLG